MPEIDNDFLTDGAERVVDDDLAKVLENTETIISMAKNARPLRRFGEDIGLLLMMCRDYAKGRFRGVSFRTIGAVVFALLYVLNPWDLVFDPLPIGIGLVDDAILIALVIQCLRIDVERYRQWKTGSIDEEDEPKTTDSAVIFLPEDPENCP